MPAMPIADVAEAWDGRLVFALWLDLYRKPKCLNTWYKLKRERENGSYFLILVLLSFLKMSGCPSKPSSFCN